MKTLASSEKLAVSTQEAAQMLSVSPRTIRNYIAAKLLQARKIGRRTVIPVGSLEAFLRRDHVSPARSARKTGSQRFFEPDERVE
jgi:excisionase family DNA binding protein